MNLLWAKIVKMSDYIYHLARYNEAKFFVCRLLWHFFSFSTAYFAMTNILDRAADRIHRFLLSVGMNYNCLFD